MGLLNGLLLKVAASVGVIGGADSLTAIFVVDKGSNLLNALTLAWQGMTGIFVVMIIIALIVYGLAKFTSK